MRGVDFTPIATKQMFELQKDEPESFKKLLKLLEVTIQHPFEGIGKPEALKHKLRGLWSRRITDKHRLVYEILEDKIVVISCKFHYDK